MKKFTKLMAIMLVAVLAVSCFAFNASAADKTVTVTVGDVEVAYDEAKLALLADGNTASDATAFNNEGLVSFENKGFTHTDGVDAAVEATFEIVLDLGEVQTIGSISLDAFKDSASMVALPTVDYYVSLDGKNYYQINAGAVVSPAEDAAETAVATLKADFITRTAVKAQYVKAVVTFKNGWVFLSELSVGAADANAAAIDDLAAGYAYSEHTVPSPGIGVYDSTDGELDLTLNDAESGKHFSNSQLIKAAYDADADAYKVIYSKVNPWPDGHTGTETMGEGEILVAISTGGTVADAFSGAKWIARGLTEGDWLVLKEGVITFLPSYAIVPEQGGDESSDAESSEEESSEPEVDLKAEYVAELEAALGEATADPSFKLALDSVTEDGVVTATLTVTDIKEDLGIVGLFAELHYDSERLTLTNKINEDGSVDCFTTKPDEKWENLVAYKEGTDFIGINVCINDANVPVSADKPLVLTFTFEIADDQDYAGLWIPNATVKAVDYNFANYTGDGVYELAEVPVADDSSDDTSVPGTGDTGVIVFAVLGLIALAGVAVVVKTRN